MASGCKSRNKHPVPSAILFFKIILAKTLEDGKLKLPNSFTRKYGGGLSNPVFHKPPDGTEWKVYWTKHDGEILLEKGWKEFATYYSLGHGHLVLFEYRETCHFEVHIFDMSGLEIDYPFHDNLDRTNDETVEIIDEMPPSKNTRQKSPVLSFPHPCKKLRIGTTGDVRTSYNLQNLHQIDQINGRKATRRTSMVISHTIGAMKEAEKFTSENPFFRVSIKPSFLGQGRPAVSIAFIKKYLISTEKQILTLQFGNKLWRVMLLCYTYSSLCRLSDGWPLFARESGLKGRDVCIFELINTEGAVFDVHIFRCHY